MSNQCETCRYSESVPIGSGPRTVLRCNDPHVKPTAKLRQWELAKIGGCKGWMRETGTGEGEGDE